MEIGLLRQQAYNCFSLLIIARHRQTSKAG